MVTPIKQCGRCKETKLVTEFSKDCKTTTGLKCYCRKCESKRGRRYYLSKRGIVRNRKSHLKARFNMTIEQYDKMFEKQDGVCAICGKLETIKNQYGIKRLGVDHDHKTEKIRGLLCNRCNRLLGDACDDIKLLKNAIQYLRSFK